jgi:hypothetical protein
VQPIFSSVTTFEILSLSLPLLTFDELDQSLKRTLQGKVVVYWTFDINNISPAQNIVHNLQTMRKYFNVKELIFLPTTS